MITIIEIPSSQIRTFVLILPASSFSGATLAMLDAFPYFGIFQTPLSTLLSLACPALWGFLYSSSAYSFFRRGKSEKSDFYPLPSFIANDLVLNSVPPACPWCFSSGPRLPSVLSGYYGGWEIAKSTVAIKLFLFYFPRNNYPPFHSSICNSVIIGIKNQKSSIRFFFRFRITDLLSATP